MKKHDIEFKVGELVTFKAYDKALPAIVREVDCPHFSPGGPDERIFYHVRGPGIISTCTGKCIIQSKYYEEYKA